MSPEEAPQPPQATPPTTQQPTSPFRSKGIIIAAIIVIVAVVIGVSALIGLGSTNQYQGYIKKIEQQTADLQEETQVDVQKEILR